MNKTDRGFKYTQFTDRYGEKCSLQMSSLATESAIWFGIDSPKPKICIHGKGWEDIKLPEGNLLSGRMHLTQDQVKELLPHLLKFAETGEL